MVNRKIKMENEVVDIFERWIVPYAKVSKKLSARIVDIPEISKTEAEQYQQLGSPVMIPEADKLYIFAFGSRMLNMYGESIDDVVGYRILDSEEESEFRQQCGNEYATVICYYAKKVTKSEKEPDPVENNERFDMLEID